MPTPDFPLKKNLLFGYETFFLTPKEEKKREKNFLKW